MTPRGWWQKYQTEQLEREAQELRRARFRAELAEVQAGCARLACDIQALKARQLGGIIKKTTPTRSAATEKELDRIFYLPAGRVFGFPRVNDSNEGQYISFDVTPDTVVSLNSMASSFSFQGHDAWMDLNHDGSSRCFEIARFELVHSAVYCYGRYTTLGRELRDAGRISGVSPTFYPIQQDEIVVSVFDIPSDQIRDLPRPTTPIPQNELSIMGAILTDNYKPALKSCATPAERWKRIKGAFISNIK